MTQLIWGAVGERFYEAGVDRGVLYVNGVGVPWNGLISVSENPTGGDVKAFYVDGYKYLNLISGEEFEASIEAYTYPAEFAQCDGTQHLYNGLFATQQKRKPFSMSYRTMVGNDLEGTEHAYKIHIIYNVLASPSERSYETVNDSLDPVSFSWSVTTKPPRVPGRKATAHFVIDSRETPTLVLAQIEEILYGSLTTDARIPDAGELIYIFESYNTSLFDAGVIGDPYYATFDGETPSSVQTALIDGGGP